MIWLTAVVTSEAEAVPVVSAVPEVCPELADHSTV